jgi:alpha-D-ribose 1-methylphosphonate 5-triphosphate synthase subunit PhnH
MEQSLEGGFAQPTFGAQSTFRAVMDALANPGTRQELTAPLEAPLALGSGLAAIALTLCDHDTNVWLDPSLASSYALVAWLRFHTAAPVVAEPGQSLFALVARPEELPRMDQFQLGAQDYPDRSTTIALALPSLTGGPDLTLRGPGIKDHTDISPQGLPADFVEQWAANRELFPRGIDLLLVAGSEVIGLPRTTRITMEAH